MADSSNIQTRIAEAYKKYILTRAGIGIPVLVVGVATFFTCLTQLTDELNYPLYAMMLGSMTLTITGGAEAFRFLFWFRPEKCKDLLTKTPERMEYVGLEKHWLLGWRLEFGSYGAETYRVVGKQNLVWSYFIALSTLNTSARLKYPDELSAPLTDSEKQTLQSRRVTRPTVSY